MDQFCAQASREYAKSLIIPEGISTANGESLKTNGHGVVEGLVEKGEKELTAPAI